MPKKITLPVCGKKVEIPDLSWDQATELMEKRSAAMDMTATATQQRAIMKKTIVEFLGKEAFEIAKAANKDVLTLYNQLVTFTFDLPDEIKNS